MILKPEISELTQTWWEYVERNQRKDVLISLLDMKKDLLDGVIARQDEELARLRAVAERQEKEIETLTAQAEENDLILEGLRERKRSLTLELANAEAASSHGQDERPAGDDV